MGTSGPDPQISLDSGGKRRLPETSSDAFRFSRDMGKRVLHRFDVGMHGRDYVG